MHFFILFKVKSFNFIELHIEKCQVLEMERNHYSKPEKKLRITICEIKYFESRKLEKTAEKQDCLKKMCLKLKLNFNFTHSLRILITTILKNA